MYDTVGFKSAYLLLGSVALIFTVLSMFTLSGKSKSVAGNISVKKAS